MFAQASLAREEISRNGSRPWSRSTDSGLNRTKLVEGSTLGVGVSICYEAAAFGQISLRRI